MTSPVIDVPLTRLPPEAWVVVEADQTERTIRDGHNQPVTVTVTIALEALRTSPGVRLWRCSVSCEGITFREQSRTRRRALRLVEQCMTDIRRGTWGN